MAKMTSAEAAKLLRETKEELASLLQKEEMSNVFSAAVTEDIESVRPEYDYASTRKEQERIEARIREIKHAISIFNARTLIPKFDMTVDQMLIYLPQLAEQKARLQVMSNRLPKQRSRGIMSSANIIDYTYANYDIPTVAKDYEKVSKRLAEAQTALDLVNTTKTLEIPE